MAADWRLEVRGPRPFTLGLAELEAGATTQADLPIACVEGWSVDARWHGLPLLDLVRRAGGNADSTVYVHSLQAHGAYSHSLIDGPQLAGALLATHLNGERLDLDHGYPVRLIAPDRAGVLNTKWLALVEVR
ncbi:MAG: molybdopterin-dependent oxidoreductase [Streptomyces sp.]|nr:molybdopterin-dependent oxidoreductase [Streptomyces sp.]